MKLDKLFIVYCINQKNLLKKYTIYKKYIIKVYIYKMNTIFMNSKNSKSSKPHILMLKLSDKIDFQGVKKALLYQILVFTIHENT